MNESLKPFSELDLDLLMTQAGLKPPPDFERKVLIRIRDTNAAVPVQATVPRSLAVQMFRPLHWLALISGGLFALSELLAFMFGLWTVSTAL